MEHRSAVNTLLCRKNEYKMVSADTSLQLFSYAFDGFVTAFFTPLISGARSVLLGDRETGDIVKLKEAVVFHNVSHFIGIPPLYRAIIENLSPGEAAPLKVVTLAGDKLPPHVLEITRAKNPHLEIVNEYGVTESAVMSTIYRDQQTDGRIKIGKPIWNTGLYILDKWMCLQPHGIPGEICISGQGVARGYLNNPELTVEKFLHPSPFTLHPSPLYKTGDLGRWLAGGNIEFLGRIDFQVKIRGFRIELGEIENRLTAYGDIKEAVVLDIKDERGDKYLCAYIVGSVLDTVELKNRLSRPLPDYMIPARFIQMEKIPLTANGKLDRKALPLPGVEGGGKSAAPSDEIERKLAALWSDVLARPATMSIGVEDNFFELGGHSLKATVLIARIHKVFDVKIPLAEIFKLPTLRQLAQYIKESAKDRYAAVRVTEKKEYYPLSSAQKRLYILQQMDPGSIGYNMPQVVPLDMEVDTGKLENTFEKLTARHESLRTSFIIINEEPVQRIHNENYQLQTINIMRNFVQPFDLSKAPLLRVGLIKQDEQKNMLLVDMHHIITDGVSQQVLVREFTSLYGGMALSPLKLQYKDYAEWQNRDTQKEALKQQEQYWLERFRGELPVLDLPYDYPRPAVQSFAGNRKAFFINKEETAALKALAAAQDTTLYMVLLAVFNLLLAGLGGREDIIVGTPVAGRRHADLQHIIGMFVNTLAMRNHPVGDKDFQTFLQEVKRNTLAAFENQDYAFEDLVEKVSAARDVGRNPVFDVMFTLQNIMEQRGAVPENQAPEPGNSQPGADESRTAKFDITLAAVETGGAISFSLEYCSALFKQDTIDRLIDYFKNITAAVIENPQVKPADIDMIPEAEKQRLLIDFNETAPPFPVDRTICRLFEEQVERTGDRAAVIGGKQTQLTYSELNKKSHQLAHYLHSRGVKENEFIGLMVERSLEMIIGILGILKAGCAYVPLNPGGPESRRKYILEECNINILLSNRELSSLTLHPSPLTPHPSPFTSLAYVIFTSGSTGNPKGVPITHSNLSPLLHWGYKHLGISPGDRTIQNLAYYFDWSVWEIFMTLTSGASLYMVPDEILLNPEACIAFIDKNAITVLHMTPSQYQYLVNVKHKLETLKYLFIGAEKLTYELVRLSFESVSGHCRVFNMYGPTECTIIASVLEIHRPDIEGFKYLSSIPIGGPAGNTGLFVLDKYLNVCPVNVPGELYINGEGVARGYLNSPELTAEKFCRRRQMLYKTGDLVRWLSDGNIEFLGRIDDQVKIRGFRIELGEIESRLLKHPQVKDAVVLTRGEEKGDPFLCAYIVAERMAHSAGRHGAGREIADTLREYLLQNLPDYMIPEHFIPMEKIPLTANGKLDRKALPQPEIEGSEKYIAPSDEIEEQLTAIWSEVLSIAKDKISIDAGFFRLGGHSLKATVLIAKIHKAFDVKMPLTQVFQFPTIRQLSRCIKGSAEEKYAAILPVEKREYYPLSSAQKRLYILQQMDPGSVGYNMPQVLPLPMEIDKERMENTFKELISRHESLRTSFTVIDDQPVQRIHGTANFEIEYFNLAAKNAKNREGYHHSSFIIHHSFVHPFDLSQAPLLRVGLIEQEEQKNLLLVDMHHIITDGISQEVFTGEFMTVYNGMEAGLSPLKVQYKDYARWQNSRHERESLKKQEAFWVEQFAGEIPLLDLPLDYARPQVQGFEGGLYRFTLDRDMTKALKALAARVDATPYMVLLSTYYLLLAKLSGSEDIVVGSPIAGRRHEDLQNIVGMFINTLALRNYPTGEQTFTAFLKDVRKRTLAAFDNQDYQFEELVDRVSANITRDTGRNPLFDVMFSLQNQAAPRAGGGVGMGEGVSGYENENTTSKFDMTLTAIETAEDLRLSFQYSTSLFKKETIRRFVTYYKTIISAVTGDPERKIGAIEILSEEERTQLLEIFNRTGTPYPHTKTIHRLFEEQAAGMGDRAALVGKAQSAGRRAQSNTFITYDLLNKKSNRLAGLLRMKGIGPGSIAAIMAEPAVEMVTAVLAVLKAGACYLPIDPLNPPGRIAYMLEDSETMLLLTQTHLADTVAFAGETVNIGDEGPYKNEYSAPGKPGDSLYMIYTSGTTGKPKGVVLTHGNLVNYVHWFSTEAHINEEDKTPLTSSFGFDLGYTSLYPSLLKGGQLHILSKETYMLPGSLLDYIRTRGITYLKMTPSLFGTLVSDSLFSKATCRTLRLLVLGGEAIRAGDVESAYRKCPHLRIMNHYGPTEATIGCIARFIDPAAAGLEAYKARPTIGRPIYNTQVYILDRYLNLVPIGVAGELCLSGAGIALGYFKQPSLTAAKFCLRRPGGLFLKKPPPWTPHKNFLLKQKFCGGPGGGFSKRAPWPPEAVQNRGPGAVVGGWYYRVFRKDRSPGKNQGLSHRIGGNRKSTAGARRDKRGFCRDRH